jgi:hypothetical protein
MHEQMLALDATARIDYTREIAASAVPAAGGPVDAGLERDTTRGGMQWRSP